MLRRQFLSSAAAAGLAGLAGCTDLFETRRLDEEPGGEPQVLEDRPDAVYVPTHREGMEMIGTGEAGEYTVGLMYSFPHRFWTVTGSQAERVDVREADDVHLMASVWDGETGTALPVDAGPTMALERDGDLVTEKTPWPMLSQNMGFHFGDNFALEGDGTYAVRVAVGAMDVERFGAFEGRFAERGEVTVEFEFSASARDDLAFERLEDRAGDRGALDLMEMDMVPTSTVPAPADLPGRTLGRGESGDATFAATAVEEAPFADDGGAYLLVSPRTPYNRIPLPTMSLSFALERDGEVVAEGPLREGLDPDAGLHYGAAVEGVESGDALTIGVDAPPQASRHEGYETAFLEMPDVAFTVE